MSLKAKGALKKPKRLFNAPLKKIVETIDSNY